MNPLRHKFLPISFGFAMIGLFFSAYNILETTFLKEVCLTNCNVFSHFTIMGFSLWWLSALVFATILILSLFGLAYLIRLLTAWALFLDMLLFVVMLNTTLCIMCTAVGVLFACSYYAVRYENRRAIAPYPKTLLLSLWSLVFVALLGSGFNANIEGYALNINDKATTNVFFSPSCSACRQLLEAEHDNPYIRWYPVEENEDDIWRILFIQNEINNGSDLYDAFLKAERQKPENDVDIFENLDMDYFVMQFRIWKNNSIVKRRTDTIPYIEIMGSPKNILSEEKIELKNGIAPQNNTINNLIGKDTNLCGDQSKPCDE